MDKFVQWCKSKTLIFGAILTVCSLVEMVVPFIPKDKIGVIGLVVGAVVIVLRFLTQVAVSAK